ncbi:MAG: hypothetical protein KatS3mg057_1648 [Herpetosiphonaceae bacterium]|nr:MAG: hypothetical protein KatS3mg057_1648 [Herpetosiphonaceae bacterium]
MTLFRSSSSLNVREDGGLASVLGSTAQTLARERVLHDPLILGLVRDELRLRLDKRFLDPFAPAEERNVEVVRVLREAISQARQQGAPLAQVPTDDETLLALFAATLGWGPAQRYLDDPRINEVKIIGRRIRVQESGKPFVTVSETFASATEVFKRAVMLASLLDVTLDGNTPQATLPVGQGTRMHVTIPPRTDEESTLVCIRRGRREAWDLRDVLRYQSMDETVLALLELFSRARCSFLIAGRTSSGKTGLLEALANSWPGEPHIVSIEDHTQEIGIRRKDLWTREMVNTQKDLRDSATPIGEFGRVAREALRQTPDLLLPGEIRGNEAGAILTLLISDHPVITTIHARSCREAIERFANCAALPGAYMYEGRRDDALRDACIGFDVVIKMDFWEEIGRRVITEIALLDGTTFEHGRWAPELVPLVKIDATDDGRIVWEVRARAGGGGMLEWLDGEDLTPEPLREKLKRARAMALARTAATSLDVVQSALQRADDLLLAGESDRAFATLKSAWDHRRDTELLVAAQRALAQDRDRWAAVEVAAQQAAEQLRQLVAARRWAEALRASATMQEDLAVAALGAPTGGWEALESRIKEGFAFEAAAVAATSEAEVALAQGQPRIALDILARFHASDLNAAVALPLLSARERAMDALIERGEGSPEVLATIRAQRQAVERMAPIAPWSEV